MTSDRFKKVERLFQEARRLDPDARGAFLTQAGAGDASLRQEVEALLREHDQTAGAILDEPALGSGFRIDEPEAITGSALPKRIGRYDTSTVSSGYSGCWGWHEVWASSTRTCAT